MTTALLILIALVTLGAAATAMVLRNLIHSVLLLIGSWIGVSVFYLWAGAEFVAFAQVLVYVGAVSMVVLFAVLLTRRSRSDISVSPDSASRAISAVLVGACVLGVLVYGAIFSALPAADTHRPSSSVHELGIELLGTHAAALLIIGMILTVATLGAVVIASGESEKKKEDPS
jgi:NADH:ubiquinone oxidoreductase subunit 6 (subunit J)